MEKVKFKYPTTKQMRLDFLKPTFAPKSQDLIECSDDLAVVKRGISVIVVQIFARVFILFYVVCKREYN